MVRDALVGGSPGLCMNTPVSIGTSRRESGRAWRSFRPTDVVFDIDD